MRYAVLDDSGKPLDAHFEIESSDLILHSRGGTLGKDARNSQYEVGLRLLIERLRAADAPVDGVFVDSSRVQSLPLEQRRILTASEATKSAADIYGLLATRMKTVGKVPSTSGGNSTKKIRLRFASPFTEEKLVELVGAAPERLPASELAKVSAQDLLFAVDQLLAGAAHRFGESEDYDVLLDTGERLAPKAVFGIAATHALGFTVLPGHFSGGVGTPCFRALEGAGYGIVPKDKAAPPIPPEAADREYAEGTPKLRSHLRKERRSGLAAAKKEEFRNVHGRLFCERCNMDPVKMYGDASGEACIEVHHDAVQVQDMAPGHKTKLTDLKCLCASCHRVLHRRLRDAELSQANKKMHSEV